MLSIEYSEALSEIDDIFEHLDIELLNKIPQKFKNFVSSNKSKTYKPNLDHSKKINEINLREKTKEILSVIYMNFLCDDAQKSEYIKKLRENSIKKERELQAKYSPNDIFQNNRKDIQIEQNILSSTVAMIEHKNNLFTKIINKIKSLFIIK